MDYAEVVFKYFPQLNETQKKSFIQLGELFREWNEKINLISRKDIDHLYLHHVLHSLSIYRFNPFQPGTLVLDIGTGGGFPGIPLAILQPDVHFTLVDSIGKKIKVVQEIATALGITNIVALHTRAESVKGKFDFVVSRAVAPMPDLVHWCQGKNSTKHINAIPNGLICLKGGEITVELKAVKKGVQVFELSTWFSESFFETKKLVYLPF